MVANENDSNLESVKFIPKSSNQSDESKSTTLNIYSINPQSPPPNEKNPSKKPRWLFIGLVVLLIVLIILGLLLFLYFHPGCQDKVNPNLWWRKEVIYQIEVSNFKDSDADALGDINGLISSFILIQWWDFICFHVILRHFTSFYVNSSKTLLVTFLPFFG